MKKILITIRNIILGIALFVYLTFTISISTLLLNRNEYGITQFGDKALILVDNQVANDNYKKAFHTVSQFGNVRNIIDNLTASGDTFVDAGMDMAYNIMTNSDANYLADRIRNELGIGHVEINFVGPVIGAHSGPGTLALFFLGSER